MLIFTAKSIEIRLTFAAERSGCCLLLYDDKLGSPLVFFFPCIPSYWAPAVSCSSPPSWNRKQSELDTLDYPILGSSSLLGFWDGLLNAKHVVFSPDCTLDLQSPCLHNDLRLIHTVQGRRLYRRDFRCKQVENLKGQTGSILGFASHVISFTLSRLCC